MDEVQSFVQYCEASSIEAQLEVTWKDRAHDIEGRRYSMLSKAMVRAESEHVKQEFERDLCDEMATKEYHMLLTLQKW